MKCRVISNHDKSHSKCIDCGREAGGSFRYENFLTTRQMYTYNTRPYIYPDDKCNINLCLNCYYDKYNTSIGFCEICSEEIFEYHNLFIEKNYKKIKIPNEFEISKENFEKGLNDNYSEYDEYEKLKNEKYNNIKSLCLDCYVKYCDDPLPELCKISPYYIREIINNSDKFKNETEPKLDEIECEEYENRSFEGRFYYRKHLDSSTMECRLLESGLLSLENYCWMPFGNIVIEDF
jgi:hypothetical protein